MAYSVDPASVFDSTMSPAISTVGAQAVRPIGSAGRLSINWYVALIRRRSDSELCTSAYATGVRPDAATAAVQVLRPPESAARPSTVWYTAPTQALSVPPAAAYRSGLARNSAVSVASSPGWPDSRPAQ